MAGVWLRGQMTRLTVLIRVLLSGLILLIGWGGGGG